MSKSLGNNFGCGGKGCCSSKSLFNFDGSTTTAPIAQDKTLEEFLDSLPPPEGPGDGVVNPGDIPDPLSVNDLFVFNQATIKNLNVTGEFCTGGGVLCIFNNTISGTGDIIVECPNINSEFLVECNFRTSGIYSKIESERFEISDPVPVIGFIDSDSILVLDNDDRGYEFNYVTEDMGNFFFNRGFMGYDKTRGRFVLWDNATKNDGGFSDKNYERALTNSLNLLDADVIYTTEINNPDYPIGDIDTSILTISSPTLNHFTSTENHNSTNITYNITDTTTFNIGKNNPFLGRFLVESDTDKSKIDLNDGTGTRGLFLYHPTFIDIKTSDPISEICLTSEDNIKFAALNDIILQTTNGSIIFETNYPANPNPIVFNSPVTFNEMITAKNDENEVASNCFIFNKTIIPNITREQVTITPDEVPSITLPAGNAGVLYFDEALNGGNGAIKGVTTPAVIGDVLVYDGSDVTWAAAPTSLQGAYDAGAPLALGTLGVIIVNDTVGKILIKDNLDVSEIDRVLFQVTDSAPGLSAGSNIFSVSNNPVDDKNIKINGNLSMEGVSNYLAGTASGMICQTVGVEFAPMDVLIPNDFNPGSVLLGTNPDRTIWYHSDEKRLKVGRLGDNLPFALAPKNIGGTNRITKISSAVDSESHLLEDTGLISPLPGWLFVPTMLIASSILNIVNADRLTFDKTNASGEPIQLATPTPVGPGGVLYYNGTNIIGVTDVAVAGDILHYDGSVVEWVQANSLLSPNLQLVYNNSNPSNITLNDVNGGFIIRDDGLNPVDDILFQVIGSDSANLFLIDKTPIDNKHVKINGNLSVNQMICNPIGIEFEQVLGVIIPQGSIFPGAVIDILFLPPIILPPIPPNDVIGPVSQNPADNVAANPDRTIWYDGTQNRFKVGDSGNNLPMALSPATVSSAHQILKVQSILDEDTHLLTETGLTSSVAGELIVPTRLIATSSANNVAADRLLFSGTTQIISAPVPADRGGVLYFDQTLNGGIGAIRGVTDPPNMGDYLYFDGTDAVWNPVLFPPPAPVTLQDAYNFNFGPPAIIELNNTIGKITIKDNIDPLIDVNGVLFEVTDGANNNIFSVDVNPANQRHVKIIGSLSISDMLSTVDGVEMFPLAANPGITSTDRTIWYSGPDDRFIVGHAGSDRPIALAPNSIGGNNRLMKVATTGNTHLLSDSGLISPALGALSVPNRLLALNINNDVASNNLIFGVTNQTLNDPAPVGPGGVLYFNGTNIIGVTDIAASGDVLFFDGIDVIWSSANALPSSTNLQDAYNNTSVAPTEIKLNNIYGNILIKDNDNVLDAVNGLLFQITGASGIGAGNNYFSVSNTNLANTTINFGDQTIQSANVTIYGDDTALADIPAFSVLGRDTNTKYFRVIPEPSDGKEVKIVGDMSVTEIICDMTGVEFGGTTGNPGLSDTNKTLWYDINDSRLKMGYTGENRPITLSPNTISGTNKIVKITSTTLTHILDDTGLISPADGELTVTGELIAINVNNQLAADRLIFDGITQTLANTVPVGPGGVLYYNGTNIVGVTDIASTNQILTYNGINVIWDDITTLVTTTLQDAYDNFDGIPPAHIILTTANRPFTIRDNAISVGTMFRIDNGLGTSLFEIEDNASPTLAEVRIADNLSVGVSGTVNTGNIISRNIKFLGNGITSTDPFTLPTSQGDGTIWVKDNGTDCPSKPYFTDFDPTSGTTNSYEFLLDTTAQTISNKLYADNYQLMNMDYTSTTVQTGGLVVNYKAVNALNNSIINGAFTTITVNKANTHTFSVGDIILITESCPDNNGLYLVLSDNGFLLTINNSPSDNFFKSSFVENTNSGGIITHVDISILKTNSYGDWEIGKGNIVPISYKQFGYNRISYMLFSNQIDVSSVSFTTIASFPWDNARYGEQGLNYSNGVFIYYLDIPNQGTTFDLDIRIVNSNESITFASAASVTTTGIKNLLFSTIPSSSDYLLIQILKSGSGPTNPIITSGILEFNY